MAGDDQQWLELSLAAGQQQIALYETRSTDVDWLTHFRERLLVRRPTMAGGDQQGQELLLAADEQQIALYETGSTAVDRLTHFREDCWSGDQQWLERPTMAGGGQQGQFRYIWPAW